MNLVIVHHEWLRIVTRLFIMFVDLSFWKVDMFQMSLDWCWWLSDDYVVSIMFFDLCLVDGVCWVVSWFWVHRDAGKHHVLWWSTRCDRFLEEPKDFVGIIFQSCIICFQDWWFSWLVTRCRRKVFAAIGERIVDVKEFTRGTWFSVGRLVVFQAQREQWVSSSQRAVVEGHSQLQGKACQGTQVIVEKTFQVESVDRTWKEKSIEAQIDNYKLLWVQKPFSGKAWSESGPGV